MKSKGFKIFVVICVVAVVTFLLAKVSSKKVNSDYDSDEMEFDLDAENDSKILNVILKKNLSDKEEKIKSDYVAVLYIDGVISEANKTYNQKWMLKTIQRLKKDSKNKGIMLFIDSPGGSVYEADEAYLALLDYKRMTGRPVYAYCASLAASGGYYLACASDKILANRNSLVGSIGVIFGQSVDATKLLDKIGVKITTVHAGDNKIMGHFSEPLNKEQKEILQSVADEAYEQFTEIVADSRNMNLDSVKNLADGRIYTAKQSVKNGLVDEICSFEDAKLLMKKDFPFGDKISFVEFKYRYEANLYDLISSAVTELSSPSASSIKLNYLAQ